MDKKASLKTIYLEWLDPHSEDPWGPIDEVSLKPSIIKTFGILLKENDQSLAVALNVNTENMDTSCVMIIPKSAVQVRYEGEMHMRRVENEG